MQIRVEGGSPIIGAKVGHGDARRSVFITPWGCSLDAPKPTPKGFETKPGESYIIDAGPAAHLIREALAEENHALSEAVSIVEGEADEKADPAPSPTKASASKARGSAKGAPKF